VQPAECNLAGIFRHERGPLVGAWNAETEVRGRDFKWSLHADNLREQLWWGLPAAHLALDLGARHDWWQTKDGPRRTGDQMGSLLPTRRELEDQLRERFESGLYDEVRHEIESTRDAREERLAQRIERRLRQRFEANLVDEILKAYQQAVIDGTEDD
jgi:hypothetical protein